jgi:hypothetical protein
MSSADRKVGNRCETKVLHLFEKGRHEFIGRLIGQQLLGNGQSGYDGTRLRPHDPERDLLREFEVRRLAH